MVRGRPLGEAVKKRRARSRRDWVGRRGWRSGVRQSGQVRWSCTAQWSRQAWWKAWRQPRARRTSSVAWKSPNRHSSPRAAGVAPSTLLRCRTTASRSALRGSAPLGACRCRKGGKGGRRRSPGGPQAPAPRGAEPGRARRQCAPAHRRWGRWRRRAGQRFCCWEGTGSRGRGRWGRWPGKDGTALARLLQATAGGWRELAPAAPGRRGKRGRPDEFLARAAGARPAERARYRDRHRATVVRGGEAGREGARRDPGRVGASTGQLRAVARGRGRRRGEWWPAAGREGEGWRLLGGREKKQCGSGTKLE
jgi:hypothetical protein